MTPPTTSMNRRSFLAGAAAAGVAAGATTGRAGAALILRRTEPGLPAGYPSQHADEVRAVVGASHSDIDTVRGLVTARPALARAAWDWGFGDWETALGAASHTGRRDIAELLIAHGARPDLFTFAMLGQVDVVRALCAANPGIQRTLGPHGIFTLMRHARAGRDDAADVVAYLLELGDADIPQPDLGLPAEAAPNYAGEYVPDGAPDVRFRVVFDERRSTLTFARDDLPSRALFYRGGHDFSPAGVPDVVIAFDADAGPAAALTITDADARLDAARA